MSQPATPLPAATVLLLRDAEPDLEVFMVVRHHQIDFASGALVFPGGKADPQDFAEELIPHLSGAHESTQMRAAQIAAIRETFEECGILLARAKNAEGLTDLISGERLATLQHFREPLNSGDLPLLDFLQSEDLVLACDQLVHFAHWITPPMLPKRFDTHFYLAVAPADHLAVHDGYESVDSVWITPGKVLEEAAAGTKTVIFPTLRNVEKLAESATVEAALAAAQAANVIPVLPWTEQRDDGNYLCIPVEAGYAVSEELMPQRPAT
jgi:8-oxo-dGTP pyrophosphatase MutT (NUDIX family)